MAGALLRESTKSALGVWATSRLTLNANKARRATIALNLFQDRCLRGIIPWVRSLAKPPFKVKALHQDLIVMGREVLDREADHCFYFQGHLKNRKTCRLHRIFFIP